MTEEQPRKASEPAPKEEGAKPAAAQKSQGEQKADSEKSPKAEQTKQKTQVSKPSISSPQDKPKQTRSSQSPQENKQKLVKSPSEDKSKTTLSKSPPSTGEDKQQKPKQQQPLPRTNQRSTPLSKPSEAGQRLAPQKSPMIPGRPILSQISGPRPSQHRQMQRSPFIPPQARPQQLSQRYQPLQKADPQAGQGQTKKSPAEEKSNSTLIFSDDDGFKPTVCTASNNKEPTFYIGGGNGVAIVQECLESLGWRRLQDKSDETYTLRWCELRRQINFKTFREGEQLVNRIPNCDLLTNKLGLLNSLRDFVRSQSNTQTPGKASKLQLGDIVPETFKLGDVRDREIFYDTYKDGEIWICKPTSQNQGKGIYLVRSLDEVKKTIDEHEVRSAREKERGKIPGALNRIIQRYIPNPLLLEGKKFDIRAYMLVANTVPFLVLFHKGYIRLSIHDYDNNDQNLIAHLTNQYVQKRDPLYKACKEDTAWTMDKFNDYINDKVAPLKGIQKDWALTTLMGRMKQICTWTFNSVKNKLVTRLGYFDLYGMDFMIDEDMKVWLIEVNVNPSLSINCAALREAVPPVVKESLYLAIECFTKSRKGRPLMPLQSLEGFQLLYHGAGSSKSAARGATSSGTDPSAQRSRSLSPRVRRTQSLSPQKDTVSKSQSPIPKTITRPSLTPKATNPSGPTSHTIPARTMFPSLLSSTSPKSSDDAKLKMTHVVPKSEVTPDATSKTVSPNADQKEISDPSPKVNHGAVNSGKKINEKVIQTKSTSNKVPNGRPDRGS